MSLAETVLACVIAQLLVLWLLGDPRLRAAAAGLFAQRRAETFAAGEDVQPDWGAGAWARPPRPAWSPAAADSPVSPAWKTAGPPGAGLRTRDWKQAPAVWGEGTRPRPPPRTRALAGWNPADPVQLEL